MIAMIPFVGDDLFRSFAVRYDRLDLLGGLNQRLDTRGGIPFIGALYGHGHHRPRLQIDRVLGLVPQVRASILHLGDLGVRVMGMGPVIVGALVLSLAVKARQVLACRCFNARGWASWVRNS